jgi:hypothetical protein
VFVGAACRVRGIPIPVGPATIHTIATGTASQTQQNDPGEGIGIVEPVEHGNAAVLIGVAGRRVGIVVLVARLAVERVRGGEVVLWEGLVVVCRGVPVDSVGGSVGVSVDVSVGVLIDRSA